MFTAVGGGGCTFTLGLTLFGTGKQTKAPGSLIPGEDKVHEQVAREADVFYNAYMIDNAYNLLRQYRSTDDTQLLWRLARVVYEKGKLSQDKEAKKELWREALELVEKALKNSDRCAPAHKWYAIISDTVAQQEGTKARIRQSYIVKQHFERALELEPFDATTWHLLGVWHFSVADLSGISRLAAKAIFGTPPSSTYEMALENFEKAEAISPGFYTANSYYLGLVLERMGRKDEALKYFKKAFYAPVVSVDDGDIHTKVYEHLKRNYGMTGEKLMTEMPR